MDKLIVFAATLIFVLVNAPAQAEAEDGGYGGQYDDYNYQPQYQGQGNQYDNYQQQPQGYQQQYPQNYQQGYDQSYQQPDQYYQGQGQAQGQGYPQQGLGQNQDYSQQYQNQNYYQQQQGQRGPQLQPRQRTRNAPPGKQQRQLASVPQASQIETTTKSKPKYHKHHAGIFPGITSHSGHSSLTLGAEYEYRYNQLLGLTGVLEFVFATPTQTVVVGGAVFHPWKDSRFVLAPGYDTSSKASHFLFRVGAGYDFHVDKVTLVPSLNADIISDGTIAWVYGVAIGIGL